MEERYEQDAESFLEGMNREYYLTGAGLKEELEIGPLFDKYGWLFTREAVARLLADRGEARARHLAAFGVESYLENGVKDLSEETTNAMMKMTVEWDGKEIPYRTAPVVVANEPSTPRRHDLQARVLARTAELNPKLAGRMRILHDEVRDLGYADYATLWDELGELKLEALAEDMRQLLETTADVYYPRLARFLEGIGVSQEEAETSDISHLFRATLFDALFPKDKLLPALRQTHRGLGIDIDSQPNLKLDVEARPLKSPRAFCAPIRVPDDVKLVIMPHGGQDDYQAILHESGHAEHFANVRPDLPFAFKYLGDNSVTEAYAMVLDNLLHSRTWLQQVLGIASPEEYLRFVQFHKLYLLRRYASKLLYELQLHKGDLTGMEALYATTLGDNLGIRVPAENYLNDVDDNFYAARYLRAWIFEVQLRRRLEEKFGEAWFASRDAGEFLRGLWGDGQRLSADELARQLGYDGLDIGPLLDELMQ